MSVAKALLPPISVRAVAVRDTKSAECSLRFPIKFLHLNEPPCRLTTPHANLGGNTGARSFEGLLPQIVSRTQRVVIPSPHRMTHRNCLRVASLSVRAQQEMRLDRVRQNPFSRENKKLPFVYASNVSLRNPISELVSLKLAIFSRCPAPMLLK